MSHNTLNKNPKGFYKTFIRVSYSLAGRAEQLGFPNEPLGSPKDCSLSELIELAQEWSLKLRDLQCWLLEAYVKEEENEQIFELISEVKHLAKRYKIGKF